MRILPLTLAMLCIAAPASAQEQGIYIFDFAEGNEAENRALARQVISDANDIVDAAVIFCGTSHLYRARDHRHEVFSYLTDEGAASFRIFDAGVCTPDITGFLNDDIGEDRVWLTLTNLHFLERFLEERAGN